MTFNVRVIFQKHYKKTGFVEMSLHVEKELGEN